MQLRGLGRITLRPLTDELPCIGAVTVTLMEQPYVDFTLRLMGSFDLMQIPGVNQALAYGLEMVRAAPLGQAWCFQAEQGLVLHACAMTPAQYRGIGALLGTLIAACLV